MPFIQVHDLGHYGRPSTIAAPHGEKSQQALLDGERRPKDTFVLFGRGGEERGGEERGGEELPTRPS